MVLALLRESILVEEVNNQGEKVGRDPEDCPDVTCELFFVFLRTDEFLPRQVHSGA